MRQRAVTVVGGVKTKRQAHQEEADASPPRSDRRYCWLRMIRWSQFRVGEDRVDALDIIQGGIGKRSPMSDHCRPEAIPWMSSSNAVMRAS